MKNFLLGCLFLINTPCLAGLSMGQGAPNLSALGHDGKQWNLKELKGKTVVIEFFNDGCPFVKKHYGPGNMQALQKMATDKGVVWLTVASSAPTKQGVLNSAKEASAMYSKMKMASSALLLDGIQKSKIAYAFGAKTTPHMYIFNAKGKLAYNGAIDSLRGTEPAEILKASPLFKNALEAVLKGSRPSKAKNDPYGCSIKY